MAISSIQMFQNNGGNSIEGLLRAGPQAISEIMNQAIQIGRQMSDKQLSQEKDLLNMRQQENALMQRRAENATAVFADNMKFDRDVGEDNRDYAANRADRAFDQNRLTANDLFSRQMEERRLGLSEKKLGMMSAEQEAENKRRAEELLNFENQFGGKGEPELPTDNPRVVEIGSEIEILQNKQKDYDTRYPGSPYDTTSAIKSLEDERTSLSRPPSAATVLGPEEDGAVLPPRDSDLPSLRADIKMLEGQKPPKNASPEAVKNYYTEIERLKQREDELSAKPDAKKAPSATAEERQFRTMVLDTVTFPDQRSVLEKGGVKPDDPRYAQADTYEKNKFENEIRSAINKSEDAYVALGGNPEERRKFWRYAQRSAGKSGGSTTQTTSPSAFDTFYD